MYLLFVEFLSFFIVEVDFGCTLFVFMLANLLKFDVID